MRGNGNFNRGNARPASRGSDGRGAGRSDDRKPFERKPFGGRTAPGRSAEGRQAGGRTQGGRAGARPHAGKNESYAARPDSRAAVQNEDGFDDNKPLQLEGRNAVLEALATDKTIDRILVKQDSEGMVKVIIAKAREKGIVVQEVIRQKLDDITETGNHQGVVAFCPAHEYSTVEEMLATAKAKNEEPLLIILDEISDPHNLGAIIRTADACGAHGVIIPKRRACGMTATVVRASAGAVAHMPVARVTNISNTIEDLKKQGIWVACADMDGQLLYDAPLTGALALVIGGEGEGVGRLIREKCDFAVKIPMRGGVSSLNASVAAAVVMFEVVRRKA